MAKVGYIRVSTISQQTARQECSLENQALDRVFIEKASGKDTNRPELRKMLEYVREGDTVVVSDISRLARSTRDLLSIVDNLQQKKVEFISLKESIDTGSAQGRFILTLFGALAELERSTTLTRLREGIEAAQKRGKHLGRKPMPYPANWESIYKAWRQTEITPSEAARKLGLKRPTFYSMVKRWETQMPLAV